MVNDWNFICRAVVRVNVSNGVGISARYTLAYVSSRLFTEPRQTYSRKYRARYLLIIAR